MSDRVTMARIAGKRLRLAFDLAPLAEATAAQINEAVEALTAWTPGAYKIGDVRAYEGAPYKCVQAHDSTANPDWTPTAYAAGWMQYHGTNVETARPYYMRDATTVYQAGEYMIWTDGQVYRCIESGAAYGPDALPGAWEAVTA